RRQTPTAPWQQVEVLAPPQVARAEEPEPNDETREWLRRAESDIERPVSRLDHPRALAGVAGARERVISERARDGAITTLAAAAKREGLWSDREKRDQGHERDFLDHADTSFLGVGITQASCRAVSNGNVGSSIAGSAKRWTSATCIHGKVVQAGRGLTRKLKLLRRN